MTALEWFNLSLSGAWRPAFVVLTHFNKSALWLSSWKIQFLQILDILSANAVIIPFAQFPLKSRRGFLYEKYDRGLLTFMVYGVVRVTSHFKGWKIGFVCVLKGVICPCIVAIKKFQCQEQVSGQGKALSAGTLFGLVPGWCHEGRFAIVYPWLKRVLPKNYWFSMFCAIKKLLPLCLLQLKFVFAYSNKVRDFDGKFLPQFINHGCCTGYTMVICECVPSYLHKVLLGSVPPLCAFLEGYRMIPQDS